ncbi:uncharacterized protein LOC100888194 [Strongylocentrotus purpuratus]|uniref:Uncharacterized protein n=1 Tax=Strongylocentrotus purpuratus TaxID=7668 RepID=A0A7M7HG01_STRPU|nr:uncharacterized protein LOC100888194 [Strongylocentrotus purpuratus]
MMSLRSLVGVPVSYLTVVGVVCCLGIQHTQGASIVEKLHSSRSRTKRQSTLPGDRCKLDKGIHRQLTEIETDIQMIFIRYVFDAPGAELLESRTCFPPLHSSGHNGQWIAARVEQIRQFMPWYREIESHVNQPDSVLQAGFYPAFSGLVNLINSTIDRLEQRVETLKNRTICACPESVLDPSPVLTSSCHVVPPPDVIPPESLRAHVASVIRLLLQIINDLHSRRVRVTICRNIPL